MLLNCQRERRLNNGNVNGEELLGERTAENHQSNRVKEAESAGDMCD